MSSDTYILLGKILSPHGVRGQVKIWSYTELPYNIVSYGPLFDKSGKRQFEITLEGQTSGGLIGSVKGVANRDEAEKLKNIELYVPRSALPVTEGSEYYQADLIGLPVFTEEGKPFGTVGTFHNFGAGQIIEIRFDDGKSDLYSFTQENFPLIDPAARRLVIRIPESVKEKE